MTPRATWLDKAIGWFSPKAGLERLQFRAAYQTGYDAVRKNRLNKTRDRSGGSGDDTLDHDSLWELRETSRDLYRNNGLFKGLINTAVRNVIGCGWKLEHHPDVEAAWNDWIKKGNCDARNKQAFWSMMRCGLRSQFIDGDHLYQKRENYSLMPIESDRLLSYSGAPPQLVNGIETDRNGAPRRYWIADYVKTRNEREGITYGYARESQGRFVDADRIVHQVDWERASHTRGVPVAASMIRELDDLDSILVSTRVAARIAAMLSFVITKNQNAEAFAEAMANRDPNLQDDDALEPRIEDMQPGEIQYLNTGEDMKSVGSEHPSQHFEPFVRLMSRLIGVPLGIPLELVLLDSSLGNFSNMRGVLQQAHKSFEDIQEFSVTPVLDDVFMWWSRWQVESGELPAARFNKQMAKWIPPGWPYIEPSKDVAADAESVKLRTNSRTRIAARRGEDINEIMDELEREEKELERRGIPMLGTAPLMTEASTRADKGMEP